MADPITFSGNPLDRMDAKRAADAAIDRVERNSHELWKELAYKAGVYLAESNSEIDSNMIADAMERYYPLVTTHEPRALGAIMRKLARDRIEGPEHVG